MVMIPVPKWVTKAREELDEFVDNLIRENDVDWVASHDSQAIESGKETIVNTLWRIYDSVNVEQRKELKKYREDVEKYNANKENKNANNN